MAWPLLTCSTHGHGQGVPICGTTNSTKQPMISLRDAKVVMQSADPFFVELQQTVFNQEMDKCTGIGRPQGITQQGLRIRHYTQGPRYIKWLFKEIWKCRVPPTVRIFGYLLLRDRLLTREH